MIVVYPVVLVDGCVLGWLMMVVVYPVVEVDGCGLGWLVPTTKRSRAGCSLYLVSSRLTYFYAL
jgi:murein tripeptide amidase MpaA